MIGIKAIGQYVPEQFIDNLARVQEFGITEGFIRGKTGMVKLPRKQVDEEASDMCAAAFENLMKTAPIERDEVDFVAVCTQNPDGFGLPHTAAVVHGRLELPPACAAFDISLGCSGYVYGLSIAKSFMESNGLRRGLFFTADPYSKVIDHSDKDTVLLFGDAATVTVLDDTPAWEIGRFRFGTDGASSQAIHVGEDRILRMNGRAVFEFSATKVPPMIKDVVTDNGLTLDEIDLFLLHQGSKYIVSTIRKRLKIEEVRAPFHAEETGNTVSSTLPLLLGDVGGKISKVVLAGFGVGLSWAGTVLSRNR